MKRARLRPPSERPTSSEERGQSHQRLTSDASTEDSRWDKRIVRAGQIAATIAAVGGTVVLVVDRLPDNQAPETLAVSLQDLHLDRDVTLARFLATKRHLGKYRAALRKSGLPEQAIVANLKTRGVRVRFLLTIAGPPRRQLDLTPRFFRARRLIRAPTPTLTQTENYESEAFDDRSPGSTWAAYPHAPGRYYVELEMAERRPGQRRQLVARAQTQIFRVGGP
jgi:hypothetical protein